MCWPRSRQSTKEWWKAKSEKTRRNRGHLLSEFYISTINTQMLYVQVIQKKYKMIQGKDLPHGKQGQIVQRAVPWWWTLGSMSWRWPSPPHHILSYSWDSVCQLECAAPWSSRLQALRPTWTWRNKILLSSNVASNIVLLCELLFISYYTVLYIILTQHTHAWLSSSHMSGSFSARRLVSVVHSDFYSTLQRPLETAAKIWNTKYIITNPRYHFIYDLKTNNATNISDLIVSLRKGDSWEQITGDSIEQWNIMGKKLWLINILYGPQQLDVTISDRNEG